jgi:hypothetical protein
LKSIDHAPAATPCYLQWINASRGSAVQLITVEEIVYFRSDQKYTLVVTPDGEALIKKTIRELTDELDPTMFWQVPSLDGRQRACDPQRHARRSRQPHAAAQAAPRDPAGQRGLQPPVPADVGVPRRSVRHEDARIRHAPAR